MKTLFPQFHKLLFAGVVLAGWLGSGQAARAQAGTGSSAASATASDAAHPTRIILDGPRYKGPAARFYVDGTLQDSTRLSDISPNDIEQIFILKNQVAASIEPTALAVGLVVITTKQHANEPKTKDFDRRVALLMCQSAAAPEWLPGQPAPAGARFFLNGAAVSRTKIEQLNPRRLTKTEVLTGRLAADYAHDPTALSVLVVATR